MCRTKIPGLDLSVYKHLWCCCSSVSKPCLTFCNPWTAACQAFCPSPSPGVYSNSCPLSEWCHPTISSFVAPFSWCPHEKYSILFWVLWTTNILHIFANQGPEYNFPSPTWYIRPGEIHGIHGPHSLENSMDRGAWGPKESHRIEWLTHRWYIFTMHKNIPGITV